MKVFFVGDFDSNNGPGIANKNLRVGFDGNKDISFSQAQGFISRTFEAICNIIKTDAVVFCSSSKLNRIGLIVAKLFKKKSFYIMHGYRALESTINGASAKEIEEINKEERYVFSKVDKVFCVSKEAMLFMQKNESKYKAKFDYNFNAVNLNKIDNALLSINVTKQPNQILSIGGGMKRKMILSVCKAIDTLNKKGNDYNLIVVGKEYTDKEEICGYNFVKYYDALPYEKIIEIMKESYLYVQNSLFETFGLAVIEALLSDCNLLISQFVGSKDIIDNLIENDIINNPADINEIADKIECIMNNSNAQRLSVNKAIMDPDYSAKSLLQKIKEYSK